MGALTGGQRDSRWLARTAQPRTAAGSRPTNPCTLSQLAGAFSILLVGVIHAQQYYDAYFSVVPTIGTLFLLSFVGSGVVGLTLIVPIRRLGRSIGDLILVLTALGAIGIAVGSLASLLVSEYRPLFGFMESGYRLAIVLTLVFDSLATVSACSSCSRRAYEVQAVFIPGAEGRVREQIASAPARGSDPPLPSDRAGSVRTGSESSLHPVRPPR